jgi:hypothetical protein
MSKTSLSFQIALGLEGGYDVLKHLAWVQAAIDVAKHRHSIDIKVSICDFSKSAVFDESTLDYCRKKFRDSFQLDYEWVDKVKNSASAHNYLAKKSEADLLVISSPDTLPSPTALDSLVSRVYQNSWLSMVDSKKLPFEFERDYGYPPGSTSWCSASFLLVRNSAFRVLEGFDTDLFPTDGADVDLSWRMKLGGLIINHEPSSVVYDLSFTKSRKPFVDSVSTRTFSPLTQLTLPWKWSRDDVLESVLARLKADPSADSKKAITKFLSLKEAGDSGFRLDEDNQVATFQTDNYTLARRD